MRQTMSSFCLKSPQACSLINISLVLAVSISMLIASASPAATLRTQRPQTRDEEGVTALMRAARDGERENVMSLLERSVDINAADGFGWTALHYAAANGDIRTVKALLSKGADINAIDQSGETTLMSAVAYRNLPVVKLLIEKGAHVNQLTQDGRNALTIALRKENKKIVEILKQAGSVEQPSQSTPTAGSVSSTETRPIPLNFPAPRYTERARQERIQGAVGLRILIGADGTVKRCRILKGLQYGLSYQAMDAVYPMIFKPATKNGQPVEYWQAVDVEFNLRSR